MRGCDVSVVSLPIDHASTKFKALQHSTASSTKVSGISGHQLGPTKKGNYVHGPIKFSIEKEAH
jgi:hypothetical protein